MIIDIHAHLFNLRYLPVAGILRRYANNKIPVNIALGVEWFLWRKTGSSYPLLTGEEIVNENETGNRIHRLLGITRKEFGPDQLIQMNQDELLDALRQKLNEEDINDTPLAIALDEFNKIDTNLAEPIVRFSNREKTVAFTREEYLTAYNVFKKMLLWAMNLIDQGMDAANSGINHLRWFMVMMYSEKSLYAQLANDNKGVTNYVHLMMDVDHFFVDEENGRFYNSYYSFNPTQVSRMVQLQKDHDKELIGFVAFNPARENCLQIIKQGLSRGFNGVKFYPPMGYLPFNDANPVYRARIEQLIDYCVEKEVPLFTHCNNSGFQAFPLKYSGYKSNPVHWEKVLKIAKNKKLRLCLGHAGGGEGWCATNSATDHVKPIQISANDIKDKSTEQSNWNNSYAAMVFKLCVEYPNVYCDFSYLDDIINHDGSTNPKKQDNLKKRLLKLFKAEPKFAKKIVYGSDWHMLYREGKNAIYYQTYKAFFELPELVSYQEDFFQNNAKTYLRL